MRANTYDVRRLQAIFDCCFECFFADWHLDKEVDYRRVKVQSVTRSPATDKMATMHPDRLRQLDKRSRDTRHDRSERRKEPVSRRIESPRHAKDAEFYEK